MQWILLFLVAIIVLVFLPGVPTTIMLIILSGVLLFIVGSLVYSYIKGQSSSNAGSAGGAQPCNTCSGQTPTPCNQCGTMPCQCAQVLPGQSQCPMCPGLLGKTSVSGAVGCNSCNRVYRCPGCLLGGGA